MAWPMPPGSQWNPGMPMAAGPDNMNMGTYTHEQWSMMQQQSWQWAQWQQQYAQWQNQYGDKYNQQIQSMQAMGMAPPLPPSNIPPPAPPPPDKPPPPPHENDEPLFGTSKGPAPVPPPNSSSVPINHQPISDRHSSMPKISNTDENESQQGVNTEALKKLAEEERIFDIQFKKWEEEIEKWKEENVNHPDKQAYSEYEQKFEACRAQLLERRQQMNQKRAKLLNIAPQQKNNKNTGNVSTNIPPPQQYNKSNNYSNVPPVQQSYKDNSGPYGNNRNMSQPHQYNMPQYNYNKDDRNLDLENSNQHYNDNEEEYGHIDTDNSFLPSSGSAKGIPGLDLVPEDRMPSNQKDVIDITDDQNDGPQSKTYPRQNPSDHLRAQSNPAPDYSTISQGINNILGDEKIMNILSMVAGQQSNRGINHTVNNTFNINNAPPQMQPANNQWSKNDNNYINNRQPTDFSSPNLNYPPPQQNQFNNPPSIQRNYDNRQDTSSEHYYDNNSQGNQYGNQSMNTRNIAQPLMQINTQMPRPLMQNMPQRQPEPQHVGPNRRGMHDNREVNPMYSNMGDRRGMQGYEESPTANFNTINPRGMLDNKKPIIPTNAHIVPEQRVQEQRDAVMPPMKPKWDRDPLFTPSVIVEYDHKALRLKARDFIEPVHTFDYNHMSKDGEGYKRKFDEEADQFFTRLPRKLDMDRDWSYDRHSRDMNYRDSRQSRHEIKNDDYYDSGRSENFYQRRFEDRRYDERDRNSRNEDPYREKEYDRTRDRERLSGKDSERNRDLVRPGRDRESFREKDFEKDRDLARDKIYGRDREGNRGREDKDRDNVRDRERDHARDKYRDRRSDRTRSHSTDRDNRKRGASNEIDINNPDSKKIKTGNLSASNDSDYSTKPKHIVMIDDILEPPGREIRPAKIVIVLRGPPGSGKSYLAKLIRDREAEHGGAARIMSIDDYFMQEGEIEEKDPTTGKIVKKPSLKYEYDESVEESYMSSLKRAFKRTITDGYYSFLIYDAVNDQLRGYADIWNFARQNGFQVYICSMELDSQVCFKRNIHNRKLEDIEVISSRFFPTPAHHIQLDATTLLQSASIPEVHMEDVSNDDIVDLAMDEEPEVENSFTSKWEKMDDANQLARLDGINKPLRPSQLSMEDYLQLDDWKPNTAKPGKKTVRWADLEERRQQEKMRAIGFVVGQTDWNRMTDPTMGSSALTQTKYIERVRRH